MLAAGTAMIADARSEGRAVAAMTVYTLESLRAVIDAAERSRQPVIVQVGSSSYAAVGRTPLASAALAAAEEAAVPVGVHLDHSTSLDEIDACLLLGYTSVMVDGSHLAFEDNVALTQSVVSRAHAAGAWVEGELGALAGDEDASSGAVAAELTDPRMAAEFASRTGVDALAVAIGNVHGFTDTPVRLDLRRLAEIRARTPAPLVLHGASGLPDDDVAAAVAGGVAKVNLNAELRRAYLEALATALPEVGDDVRALQRSSMAAMSAVALDRIKLLAGLQS